MSEHEAGQSGHEVITVQLGNYANTVGAHFWNAQMQDGGKGIGGTTGKSTDLVQDRMYRTTTSATGDSVKTPRAVMVDLSGATGPLATDEDGVDSYEAKSAAIAWGGALQRTYVDGGAPHARRSTAVSGSGGGGASAAAAAAAAAAGGADAGDADQQEVEPALWSDILQQQLHKNTMTTVRQYRHGDESSPFNQYAFGKDAFRRADLRDQIDDQVHFFLEECDSPQGIQLMVDLTDGFAGLGASVVESFREDHGKLPIMCMGMVPPGSSSGSILNVGQAVVEYSDLVSLLMPVSTTGSWGPAELTRTGGRQARLAAATKTAADAEAAVGSTFYDASSVYQSAAVLAAAWDAASTGYRVANGGYSMASMAGAVSMDGTRPIAALSGCIPLPLGVIPSLAGQAGAGGEAADGRAPGNHSTLSSLLAELGDEPWSRSDYANSFCPGFEYQGTPFVSCTTVRGFGGRQSLLRASEDDMRSGRTKVTVYDRASSASEAMMRYYGASKSAGKFFVTEASRGVRPLHGAFSGVAKPFSSEFGGMPTFAAVSSDPGLHHTMANLSARVGRVSREDLVRFDAGGFGSDDVDELKEALSNLAEKYNCSDR